MRLLLFFDREQIVFPAAENVLTVGKVGGIIKLDDEIVQSFGYAIVDNHPALSTGFYNHIITKLHKYLPKQANRAVVRRDSRGYG